MKKYTKEEVYQIRKGYFVVVFRTGCRKDWDLIGDAMHASNRGEEHDCIEYLLDRGMFVRRSDDDITISTNEGEATYPIRQVLLSMSPDFIEEEFGADYLEGLG
jgi:hypothetical protein